MATKAFVLLSLEPNKSVEAQKKLASLPGVKNLASTAGRYDVVLTVEDKDFQSVGNFVRSKVREIPGVRNTETLFEIE